MVSSFKERAETDMKDILDDKFNFEEGRVSLMCV